MSPQGWMQIAQVGEGILNGATDYLAAKEWEKKFKEEQKDQEEYATSVGESLSARSAALQAAKQWDPSSQMGALAAAGISNLFKKKKDKIEIDPTPAVINGISSIATGLIGNIGNNNVNNKLGGQNDNQEVPVSPVSGKQTPLENNSIAQFKQNSPLLNNTLSLNNSETNGFGESTKPFNTGLDVKLKPINQNPVMSQLVSNTGSSSTAPPVGRTSNIAWTLTPGEYNTGFRLNLLNSDVQTAKLGLKLKLIPK